MHKGRMFRLGTGVTVVPYETLPGGFFMCVVVAGSTSYPVGGYNIMVDGDELERGKKVPVPS